MTRRVATPILITPTIAAEWAALPIEDRAYIAAAAPHLYAATIRAIHAHHERTREDTP